MNGICHFVNVYRVVVLLVGGGAISTLHVVIKLVRTFCTQRWWGPKNLVFTHCDTLVPSMVETLRVFLFVLRTFINPFHGTTDTLVLDIWWCLPWVSKPGWIPCMLSHLCDPQIHLWLYGSQYGSQAFLIHILTDVSTSIGGGLGQTRDQTHNHLCSTQPDTQSWYGSKNLVS